MRPYYADDYVTLYHADYRDVIGEIDGRGILVTDPPFFLPALVRQSQRDWPRSIGNLGVMSAFFRDMIEAVAAASGPDSAAYIFCDSTSYPVFFASAYAIYDRTQCIVWDKGRGGMGRGWRHSHEMILHCARIGTTYADGMRRDVVYAPVVPSRDRDHPSEKPELLLSQIIRAHPGRAITDLFCGTGSTLQVAKRRGRTAIGADIDERMCEIAATRLAGTRSMSIRSTPRGS